MSRRREIEELDREIARLRSQGYYIPSIPYKGKQDLMDPSAPINSTEYRERLIEIALDAGPNPDMEQVQKVREASREPASVDYSSGNLERKSYYMDKVAREKFYEEMKDRIDNASSDSYDRHERRIFDEHVKRTNESIKRADQGVADLIKEGKSDYMTHGTVDNAMANIEEEVKYLEKLKREQDLEDKSAKEETGYEIPKPVLLKEGEEKKDDSIEDEADRIIKDIEALPDPEKEKPPTFFPEEESDSKKMDPMLLGLITSKVLDRGFKDYGRMKASQGDPYAAMFGSKYRVGKQGFERSRSPIGGLDTLLRIEGVKGDEESKRVARALLGGGTARSSDSIGGRYPNSIPSSVPGEELSIPEARQGNERDLLYDMLLRRSTSGDY